MKTKSFSPEDCILQLSVPTARIPRSAPFICAIFAGVLLAQTQPALAALGFARGTQSAVGCVGFSSVADDVTITGDYTAAGVIDNGLSLPAGRIQYDMINCSQLNLYSWTIYYSPLVGPSIYGAATPIGYVDQAGNTTSQGGAAYGTLFNAGYGVYNYNTDAPWTIDYEVDHITFTYTGTGGFPAGDGVGYLSPAYFLPSFSIEFDPNLLLGTVNAAVAVSTGIQNGTVIGPVPANPCITLRVSDVTVYTCSNCTTVPYNVFATNLCCQHSLNLSYSIPTNYCFPVNTSTRVYVTASDPCGDKPVTNSFLVNVLQSSNCGSNRCLTLTAQNILAYTCSNCTTVKYQATVTDKCCPGVPPTLVFNPPQTTCFGQNTTTPVTVTAYDQCGNTAGPVTFNVTVLPGPNCNSNHCITVTATNITVYTCSNCTTVLYNNTAVSDPCCPTAIPTLIFNPPPGFCFPQNSTTPVTVTAKDACGNVSAPVTFNVTVLPSAACQTNCITLTATNLVFYTCSNCVPVNGYHVKVTDTCCSYTNVSLVFNPPKGTCFPINSTTPVTGNAFDQCGNSASVAFFVTVLPASNCASNTPGSGAGGLTMTGTSGGTGGSGANLTWPSIMAQLQQSSDLVNWISVPGATNPPFNIPQPQGNLYFRLQYVSP